MKKLGFLLVMLGLSVPTVGCTGGDTKSTPPPPAAGEAADKAADEKPAADEDAAKPAEGGTADEG